MNPVPASVKAPRLPQVNLIPPELAIRRARSRQRGLVVAILVLFLLVLGALGYYIHLLRVAAQEDLASVEARQAELQNEIASFREVPQILEALRNATDARAYAGATELNFFEFLTRVAAAIPPGIEIDNVTIKKVTLTANSSPATDPFAQPDIGEVSFSASSLTPVSAADLSEALEQVVGLERVRVSVTTRALDDGGGEGSAEGQIVYLIEASGRMTIEALSGRFAPDNVPHAAPPAEETTEGDA